MMVPPPSAARETCSPRRAKSADNIEGASSINLGLSGKIPKFYHAGERWADTLIRTFYNLSFRAERIVKRSVIPSPPSGGRGTLRQLATPGAAFGMMHVEWDGK